MARNQNRTAYKYDAKYHDAWCFSLSIKGATDEEIAAAFGVSKKTIVRWSKKKNEKGEEILTSFGEARRAGKEQADAQVIKKLYERCLGYEVTEAQNVIEHDSNGVSRVKETRTSVKHIAPDVMAIMYWLNNRSRKTGEWSQRQDINITMAQLELISRRLDLEFLKAEAMYPVTEPEETGSNFENALRDTADEVWAGYNPVNPNDCGDDG